MNFTVISTVCFTPKKNTCTCMHTVQEVRSCEYTQPPKAFTRTGVTARIKHVYMLYLGAYTEGGRYFGWWALFRMGVITVREGEGFVKGTRGGGGNPAMPLTVLQYQSQNLSVSEKLKIHNIGQHILFRYIPV